MDAIWRARATRVGRALFGADPTVVYIPSDESYTFELSWADRAARIVKFDTGEGFVEREQHALPFLRARGFPEFPEIEHTQADIEVDDAVFNVMPKAPSVPLDELWSADPGLVRNVASRTGDFLRRLAVVPWETCPRAVSPVERAISFPDWFDRWWAPLRETISVDVDGVIDAAIAMMRVPPAGFGGWAGGAVLTDGTSFTAIDWASIGAFWPICDLASRTGFDEVGEASVGELDAVLIDAYTQGEGLTEEQASELSKWYAVWALFHAGGLSRAGDPAAAQSALAAVRCWAEGGNSAKSR